MNKSQTWEKLAAAALLLAGASCLGTMPVMANPAAAPQSQQASEQVS